MNRLQCQRATELCITLSGVYALQSEVTPRTAVAIYMEALCFLSPHSQSVAE